MAQLRDQVEHDFARVAAEAEDMRTDVEHLAGLDRRVSDVTEILEDKINAVEYAYRQAVVKLQTQELRAQTDGLERHRLAIGSIAQGLHRVAQVCGLLPGAPVSGAIDPSTGRPTLAGKGGDDSLDSTLHLSMADVLNWELSGNSIARRVEVSWAHVAPGHGNLLDLLQKKAEQAAQKFVRIEVGCVEARMDQRIEKVSHTMGSPKASTVGYVPAPAAGSGLEVARVAARRQDATLQPQQREEPPSGPVPRGLPTRGRVLAAPATPRAAEWTRASAALVPLSLPKSGRTPGELRVMPEWREAPSIVP